MIQKKKFEKVRQFSRKLVLRVKIITLYGYDRLLIEFNSNTVIEY